jgi:hypothetical protein
MIFRTMRRLISPAFLLLVGVLRVEAAPLSTADLEELRERLNQITENASSQLDRRFKVALDDFRAGIQSDDAAMELYLKCAEKVKFTDKQKKTQDFRDWRRNHEEQHKNPHFRQALRHQLNWLCLCLRASIRPEEQDKLIPEMSRALKDLYGNPGEVKGQFETLSQGVRSSVYFMAYELGDMKAKDWPDSPMMIDAVYDKFLMPPLRSARAYDDLRSMWDERIKMELVKETLKEDKEKPSGIAKPDKPTPKVAEFQESTLPDLLWSKHKDLFTAGDEKIAALEMLKHIQVNISNVKAKEWAEEFKTLIAPPAPTTTETTPAP